MRWFAGATSVRPLRRPPVMRIAPHPECFALRSRNTCGTGSPHKGDVLRSISSKLLPHEVLPVLAAHEGHFADAGVAELFVERPGLPAHGVKPRGARAAPAAFRLDHLHDRAAVALAADGIVVPDDVEIHRIASQRRGGAAKDAAGL